MQEWIFFCNFASDFNPTPMTKVYSRNESMAMLRETIKRISATPESSNEYFQRAGIIDANGQLTQMYQ